MDHLIKSQEVIVGQLGSLCELTHDAGASGQFTSWCLGSREEEGSGHSDPLVTPRWESLKEPTEPQPSLGVKPEGPALCTSSVVNFSLGMPQNCVWLKA